MEDVPFRFLVGGPGADRYALELWWRLEADAKFFLDFRFADLDRWILRI